MHACMHSHSLTIKLISMFFINFCPSSASLEQYPFLEPVVVQLGNSSSEDEGQDTDGAPVSGLDIDSFLKAQRKTVEVKWWLQGLCGGATCHSESGCRFGVRVAVPGVQTVYIYEHVPKGAA